MADDKMDKLRNLKADNQLETEELDRVAGGSIEESIQDAAFLNELFKRAGEKMRIGTHSYKHPFWNDWKVGPNSAELKDAWAYVGVTVVDNLLQNEENEYYINGRRVSQTTAYIQAQKRLHV